MNSAYPKLNVDWLEGERILHLQLDAPPGNVLDTTLIESLDQALKTHGSSESLVAVLLEGSGKHFSFGASVEEHTKDKVGVMLPAFHRLIRRVAGLGVPTISVVRGQCLGGGLELTAVTSWIYASPEAKFGQPEIQLGVFAPVGSLVLPWRLGAGRGLDLCVSGRSVTAEEALATGLVREIAADPLGQARAMIAKDLLPRSPSSLRFAERAARLGLAELLERQLPTLERIYLEELMATPDANEGLAAFLEKRPPQYRAGQRSGHAR